MYRTMPTLRMELFRMCKNATSAMPLPHKLWLMSKRHESSYRRPALWMPDVDLYLIEQVVDDPESASASDGGEPCQYA